MEEQAKQALADLLERAVAGVDQAVEFSQAQIPDVVEQLLVWKAAVSALSTMGAIIVFACTALFSAWVVRDLRKVQEPQGGNRENYRGEPKVKPTVFKDSDGDIEPFVIMTALLVIFGVIVSIGIVDLDWLQILIAPKLYLLEYAAALVK